MRSPKNDLLFDFGVEVRRALRTVVRREVAGVANEAIEQAVARIAPSIKGAVGRAISKNVDRAVSALEVAVERTDMSAHKRGRDPRGTSRK